MPNGYVSQIQINGGDVQNIGSCAYAVCDTLEDVVEKVVSFPNFVLKTGATIHVKFTYRNTAFNPELNVNGTGAKSILLNTNLDFNSSLSLSSQYNVDQLWLAGAIVTLTYDGTNWVVNNPSRITTPFAYNLGTGGTLEPGSYMNLADIEWELCTGSSNVTARVFPFRVCMSTMVDGIYRDRSAIMEVFVGGCYNKKDYVDIMIHDESEYHANDSYVFDSLVDSIYIYFEYEVSSSNVIGKRTGHLLGKIPSRWSTFQLVPLTDMSVASANPDEDHHFLKFDIANSRSSFEPSETSQTSIPSGNVLPTTVGVHKYLIKARLKPFNIGQLSSDGSTAGQYLKSNGSGNAPSWETMDSTPTSNSIKAVTSGGIKTALGNKLPRKVFQIRGGSASSNTDRVLKIKYNGSHEFELHMRGWSYVGQTHIIYFSSVNTTNYASGGAITHIGNAIAVSDISILFKDKTLYIVNNAAADYYTTLVFTVNEGNITESSLVNLDSVPEDAVIITPKSVITDALGDSRYMPIRFGGSTPSYLTGDYTQCYDNTMHTSVRLRRFYVHTSLSNHFDNIDRKSGWTINTENVPNVSLFDGSMSGWNSPAASTVTEQNPTVVEITYNDNIDATDVLLLRLHAHRDYVRTVSFTIEVKWTNNNWYEVGTFTEVKIPFCCTLFNSSIKEATGVSGNYIYIRGVRITFTYASGDYWLSEVELLSFRDTARANASVRAIGTRGGDIYGKLNLMYDSGAISSGETGAVTGGTVYTALQGKQDSTTITTDTNNPTDNDTIIMQASGTTNTTSFLRRSLSYLWNYIQGKADDRYYNTVSGGTSQQVLLADGSTINMPSTKGTNKDTLIKNLVTGLGNGSSDVTDGTEIVTSYAANDGFSTTNYVNVPYRRQAVKFWNYIKSKLGTAGSSTRPIYMNAGVPTACNVSDRYVTWGTEQYTTQGITPLDQMCGFGHDRLKGLPAECYIYEKSTDRGVTWTEVTGITMGGLKITSGTAEQIRITLRCHDGSSVKIYNNCRRLLLNVAGTMYCNVVIVKFDGTSTDKGTFEVAGNTAWNSIPCATTFGDNTIANGRYMEKIILTLRPKADVASYDYSVSGIRMIAATQWESPSKYSQNGYPFDISYTNNAEKVTFPDSVTAAKFITSGGTTDQMVAGNGDLKNIADTCKTAVSLNGGKSGFRIIKINGGNYPYLIVLADVTGVYDGTVTNKQYGIQGLIFLQRDGASYYNNLVGRITATASYSSSHVKLYTDIVQNDVVKPCVIKKDGRWLLCINAIGNDGSYAATSIIFFGRAYELADEPFTKIRVDSTFEHYYDGGAEIEYIKQASRYPIWASFGGDDTQFVLGDGTLQDSPIPISKGGTGATTAKNAEYNLITKPRTTELTAALSDDYRIPFCSTSPSTTNGVFAGYRKASALWTYIKGKADSVYAALVHSHGDITNDGAITSSTSIDGSNDHLVFSDSSDDSKLKKTSVANVAKSMTGLANSGSATSLDDGTEFITSYSGPDGFSTTDRVNVWYKRKLSLLWTYINSKITAGTGLTKTDGTINHSNSVTAQTSDLGSYQRIPIIRYDSEGHITQSSYSPIFNTEKNSTIKCGYISNGSSGGIGWYKVGQIDYWTGTYNRFTVLISMNGTSTNSHDYGLLRIRAVNAATAGNISGINVQWIMKTPETSNGFTTDCIRVTKSETGTSSGATLFIYMKLPVNNMSYNFLVLNEAQAGSNIKAFRISFANSTAKETTDPSPTYTSTMAPLIVGNQSNCLEITDSNWQLYLTASNSGGAVPSNIYNADILTIPEGTSQVFFNTTTEVSIACIRGEGSIGRFPRNGVRITVAGKWAPQSGGGYAGGNAEGRFSAYLYDYRGGVPGNSLSASVVEAYEDFMYFNGVWYSKGY